MPLIKWFVLSPSFSTPADSRVNGHASTSSSRANTGSSDDWRRPPTGAGISQEKQKQRRENDAKVKKKICKCTWCCFHVHVVKENQNMFEIPLHSV